MSAAPEDPVVVLAAAKQWLDLFVRHLDIDPAITTITVRASLPSGERRDLGLEVTLAQTLARIDAVLAARPAAAPPPESVQ